MHGRVEPSAIKIHAEREPTCWLQLHPGAPEPYIIGFETELAGNLEYLSIPKLFVFVWSHV